MTTAFYNFYSIARVVTAVLLLFAIFFKISTTLISADLKKEFSSLTKSEGNEEKKAETDEQIQKLQEWAKVNSDIGYNSLICIVIIHYTAYRNNYLSSYYNQITSPPPDFYLQLSF